MTDHSIAKAISMHRTPEGVIEAAVEHAHAKLAADVGFAALAAPADGFQISQKLGIADPRWSNIVVRPGLGLGGQVLASGRPMLVDDYAHDRRISRDFVEIVSHGEGLRAVACVPVLGPGATEALLYVGSRTAGRLGERALDELRLIAEFAGIGTEQLRTRSLELDRRRERAHLASRLHDSVAQRLFAIGALATALRSESDVATLLEAVDEIEATAADARAEPRGT